MIYPIVIGSFALIVLVALVAFLVPVFEKIFNDFGGELPAITKFTVWLSHLVTRQWYILIAVVFGVVWLFRYWKNSETGRVQWDRLKLKFPMKIGDIVQKVALARFSRTFSGLIAAGVPMLEAIEITGKTSGNKVVEMAMNDVRDSVKKGGSLTAPMAAVPEAFPVMVTQMIGVGEETGALETMMSKVADFYEEQVDAAVKALTSILEPRDDHRGGRNRRVHRHRDVPADVQGLRLDQVVERCAAASSRRASALSSSISSGGSCTSTSTPSIAMRIASQSRSSSEVRYSQRCASIGSSAAASQGRRFAISLRRGMHRDARLVAAPGARDALLDVGRRVLRRELARREPDVRSRPAGRAGRPGRSASPRGPGPSRRGTSAARGSPASAAPPPGACRVPSRLRYSKRRHSESRHPEAIVVRCCGSTVGPPAGVATVADPSAATRRRRWAGSTCSSLTRARTEVSSMPATEARAAVRRPTAIAIASSSSSRSGGIAVPARSRYPPAGPVSDSTGYPSPRRRPDVPAHGAPGDLEPLGQLGAGPVAARLEQRQQVEQPAGGLAHRDSRFPEIEDRS